MSMAQIYEDSLEKVGEEYGPLSLQMEDKLKEVFIIYQHMQDKDKGFQSPYGSTMCITSYQ
jgi:hypothetical protein